jgi:hypothetical protein
LLAVSGERRLTVSLNFPQSEVSRKRKNPAWLQLRPQKQVI